MRDKTDGQKEKDGDRMGGQVDGGGTAKEKRAEWGLGVEVTRQGGARKRQMRMGGRKRPGWNDQDRG